ncbi:MAG: hypothetical protein ACYC5M_10075 [Anaerolineae bacterium]
MPKARRPKPATTPPATDDTSGAGLSPQAVEALLRNAAAQLFSRCRSDRHLWLSEPDLQCLLYAILQQELAARGISGAALHADYACRVPPSDTAPRRGRTLPVDLILVLPETIHPLRSRRWSAQALAVVEVKRGFERHREIREDLAKLVTVRKAWLDVLACLVVMGYRNRLEDIAAVERSAEAGGVLLLGDNDWGVEIDARQPELT